MFMSDIFKVSIDNRRPAPAIMRYAWSLTPQALSRLSICRYPVNSDPGAVMQTASLAEAAAEGGLRDAEDARGYRLVSLRTLEGLVDEVVLDFSEGGEAAGEGYHRRGGRILGVG